VEFAICGLLSGTAAAHELERPYVGVSACSRGQRAAREGPPRKSRASWRRDHAILGVAVKRGESPIPRDNDSEQSGLLRRSNSRHANTASSALQHAILTSVQPRLSTIGIVTGAHIASIELAFAADLLVNRFFALAFILTRSFQIQEFYKNKFLRDRASQRWPALTCKAGALSA
jgi:hypothetical protein